MEYKNLIGINRRKIFFSKGGYEEVYRVQKMPAMSPDTKLFFSRTVETEDLQ